MERVMGIEPIRRRHIICIDSISHRLGLELHVICV